MRRRGSACFIPIGWHTPCAPNGVVDGAERVPRRKKRRKAGVLCRARSAVRAPTAPLVGSTFGGGRGDGRLVALRLCETINIRPRGHTLALCIGAHHCLTDIFLGTHHPLFFSLFLSPFAPSPLARARPFWLSFFPLSFCWHLAGALEMRGCPQPKTKKTRHPRCREARFAALFPFILSCARAATAVAQPNSLYGRAAVHAAAHAHR